MIVRRKRGCHSGHPQAQLLAYLWIIAWVAMGIPKLRLFLLLIPSSIVTSPKTFNHTKLNKTFMRSISIRKQITTISDVANQFIFYSCIISTVFQLFYGKNSSKKIIESSKQAHNAKKTESVKNRIVCNNLTTLDIFVTPKILKNQEALINLYIDLLQV